MDNKDKQKKNTIFGSIFFVVSTLILISVLISGYIIFYKNKNYDFIIEAPCDPITHKCFVRDCENIEGCPPNNLNQYRIFHIKAKDFGSCTDNSCLNVCDSNTPACIETKCRETEGNMCSK